MTLWGYLVFLNILEMATRLCVRATDVSIIKHTLVGSDVHAVCTPETIKAPTTIYPSNMELYHQNRIGTDNLFLGDVQTQKKILRKNEEYLISVEVSKGKLRRILLIIKNANEHNEGLYTCGIGNKTNQGNVHSGDMVYLYVHKNEENNPCENNWLYFKKNNTCLRLIHDTMGWHEGVEFCKYHHNASMVRVRSEEFNRFLASVTDEDTAYWIGAKKEATTPWHWQDGSLVGNTYFATGYPKQMTGESCVAISRYNNGSWKNMECDTNNGVICERSTEAASVWRPPPLWKVALTGALVLMALTAVACCFLGIRPNRDTLASTLGALRQGRGREDDIVSCNSKMGTANTVIVIYDSELNDLLK